MKLTFCTLRVRLGKRVVRRAVCIVVVVFGTAREQASAQDASLLLLPVATVQQKQPAGGAQPSPTQPLSLENSSFMYRRLPPEAEQRELQINDIVTVLVDYRSSLLSAGDANSQRTLNFDGVLNDWLKFDGKNLMPAPFRHGEPEIQTQLDSQYQTE